MVSSFAGAIMVSVRAREFHFWHVAALCAGLTGCQSATVRRIETAQGPAMEIRCSTPSLCKKEQARLNCASGKKSVHAVSDSLWVVTCSRASSDPRVATKAGRNAPTGASVGGRVAPVYTYDDPLLERGPLGQLVKPTSTMLRSAEYVATVEARAAAELDAVQRDLAARCQAGSLDHCLAELDVTPWSALPEWGETPLKDSRALSHRADKLVELCKKRHANSCHRLGELMFVMERADSLRALSTAGGLQANLEQVLWTDPKLGFKRQALAAVVIASLKEHRGPPLATLESWATACSQGSPGACLLGAAVGWRSASEYSDQVDGEIGKEPERVSERPLAHALAEYCQTYKSLCAEARKREYLAGVTEQADYCTSLRGLCTQEDPRACRELALAINSSVCRTEHGGENAAALHQKACSLGSAASCGDLLEPSLNAKTPMLALAFALQSCQKQHQVGCRDLCNRFGRSRDHTSLATGLAILEHACKVGYADACHDVYVSDYQWGDVEPARQSLFGLCVNAEHVRACRTTAQIDWLAGRVESAISLLERQCSAANDRNSCIELGTLLAHRGQDARALSILARECQRAARSPRDAAIGAHVCQTARRLEAGVRPQTPSQMFLEPIGLPR